MVSYWRLWIVHDQCVWHWCHKTAELDFNDNVMSNIRLPVQQTVELRSLELNNRGVIRSDCMHGHRWHMHPLAVIPSVMFLIQGKYDACICIVGHLGMIVTVGMPRKEKWLVIAARRTLDECLLFVLCCYERDDAAGFDRTGAFYFYEISYFRQWGGGGVFIGI